MHLRNIFNHAQQLVGISVAPPPKNATRTTSMIRTTRSGKRKEPELEASPALPGVRVLVVEDDPLSCKLYALLLVDAGAEIRVAASAEEALAVVVGEGSGGDGARFEPHVILLDIVLPRMSGFVFVERLKQSEQTKSLKIVVATSMNGPELERMVTAAGCDAYLRKPVSADDLITSIVDVLEQ